MFTAKKIQLFETPAKASVSSNTSTSVFVTAAQKESSRTLSGNLAEKFSTTGNPFVDQFGGTAAYKAPRPFDKISVDCERLYATNRHLAIVFIFFLRMINRVVQFFDGSKTKEPQSGAELKHEGIMRMIWLHMREPKVFWNNITLFVSIGSWRDIFMMLQYDLVYHGWDNRKLDWDKFGDLILSGLENSNTSELVKKYLPQIKAKSKCKTVEAQADTMIGKWLADRMYNTIVKTADNRAKYASYRRLKSSGTAHEWQQLISQQKFDRIDFDKIHGRALHLLVKSKFLQNQGLLERYKQWIGDDEKKAVKYTGFVHELFMNMASYRTALENHIAETINKQFQTLVDKAGESGVTPLIVVRDTSRSMGTAPDGTNMSCGDIAKALALYFSTFLKGRFADAWIEFHDHAKMHKWTGATVVDKWYNDRTGYIGSTNFQSVIDLFVQLRRQGIPEEEFPKGIICISDGEFNAAELGKTNVESARAKLRSVFSEEYANDFIIVLWNMRNNYYGRTNEIKFETYGNVPNVFYMSGYSASNIRFLLSGEISTSEDLFLEAMNQEALHMVDTE